MSEYASAADIRRDVARMIRPRVRMTVSQASEKYVKVRTPGGGITSWSPSETPYMVTPMDCLVKREYDTVIFIGPARTGKTQGLIDNWAAYMIKCEPCTMQIVHMTETTANKYSRRRIDRLHRDSPALKAEMAPGASNDNTYNKYYKSGAILGISWPSISNLSGDDIKFIAFTDYDRMPEDIGGEGSGYYLGKKRTQTFGSRGMTLIDTSPGFPIIDPKWQPSEAAPHEAPPTKGGLQLYNLGTRHRLYWKCPCCNEWFMLPPDQRAFSYDHARDLFGVTDPVFYRDVGFVCTANGCFIEQHHKRQLNATALWVPEGCRIENDQVVGGKRKTRIASFWLSGAAAAYQDPNSIIEKYLSGLREYEITGSEQALKSVINTDFGAPHLPKRLELAVQASDYKNRAEPLPERVVCDGVRYSAASVDVQTWGFDVQVHGYGVNDECWIIDRFEIRKSARLDEDGHPLPVKPHAYQEDWLLLIDQVIFKRYPLADGSGRFIGIMATISDSGGRAGATVQAYKFWLEIKKRHLDRRFFLCKGERPKRNSGKGMITLTHPDKESKAAREAGVVDILPLWLINTTLMKDGIFGYLQRTEHGQDYIHFPDWLEQPFYDQLTAEVRTDDGWENPTRARNETFDLLCYAKALVLVLIRVVHWDNKINWENPPLWAATWDKNSEIYQTSVVETVEKAPVVMRERQVRMRAKR